MQYISFKVCVDGDDAYFSIPTSTFDRLREFAKSKNKKMSKLVEEGIRIYGFSENVIDKILKEYEVKWW